MKAKKKSKLFQWQQKCHEEGAVCAKCGATKNLTVDHIVPVSIVQQFMVEGDYDAVYNMEENFEILCGYCNRFKQARIDPRNPKVYSVLEKILREAKLIHIP